MESHYYGVTLLWGYTTMVSYYYEITFLWSYTPMNVTLLCSFTSMELHSYGVILLWSFTTILLHSYLLNTMVFLYSYIGNIHYLFSLRRTSNITFHKSMISKPIIALICSKCFNHNLHFCICIVCKGKC